MTHSSITSSPATSATPTPHRRGSRATLPMSPVDTPEHRAIIEHSIEAYSDVTRRFRLTPQEARDTAEGLRHYAVRYDLAAPHYLQSWGLGGDDTPAHGLYPDVETSREDVDDAPRPTGRGEGLLD